MDSLDRRFMLGLTTPDVAATGFDVRDLVCCAVESAALEAQHKQLRLKRTVESLLPSSLHGDSASLCRVLCEFVSNAVQQVDRGEICLSAALEEETAGEVTVRFSLTDSSCVLPRRMLTGCNSTEALAESIGGHLMVESSPGEGSRLSLLVSLLKASPGTGRIVLH